MTFRDLVDMSAGNLWRMKLRTALTAAGVVIAIAAFTGMLSFGVGNQTMVQDEFEKFDLFSTLLVFPADAAETADTAEAPVLDAAMVDSIASMPGVAMAYPLDAFDVTVQINDTTLRTKAQALPESELTTGRYSHVTAGSALEAGAENQVLVTSELLEMLGLKGEPDSVIGQRIVVQTRLLSLDSAVAHFFETSVDRVPDRVREISFDSLRYERYRQELLSGELAEAMNAFSVGFFEHPNVNAETLTVAGVLRRRHGRAYVRPVAMPVTIAQRLTSGGLGSDPTALVSALKSGKLFKSAGDIGQSYDLVTVKLDQRTPYEPLRDSLKAIGFETFSYAEEFEQIRRVFFYFDLALAAVGLIALVTASLGIINTMLMAITERKREIGVIKSLGADEADIRKLFLIESAVIGAVGSALGVLFGWIGARIISAAGQAYMASEGLGQVDPFATPWWLVLISMAFGIGVSVIAGLYPASRAARVDPVVALRGE